LQEADRVTGTQPITDHAAATSLLDSVGDVSTVLAGTMDTFNPDVDTLTVDLDGTKLTNEQLGDKVVSVIKASQAQLHLAFCLFKPAFRALKKLAR
jgi:hypothetical protein